MGIAATGSTWGGKLLAASQLPDPQSVLDGISISQYVRADYRDLYGMSDDKPIWDNSKDWIRTVDWEAVRSELAGTTVRFAIGAADAESAAEGLVPFEALSGIKVELVPIPDDSFYDKALAEFISGNASFDALQFFSPWLGDFAAPGFLYPLQEFADKWKLPLDDFYDTYRLNYGYFNGQMYGIPFDCDIQMVHLRKGYVEQVLGGPIDKANSVPTYDELIRLSAELNQVEPGVSGVGLMAAPGFWSTYSWEHIAAQAGMMLFDENWEPIFNGDAGMKGLEILLALSKNANEGHAGAGWPENRAAWLGGQVATNIRWPLCPAEHRGFNLVRVCLGAEPGRRIPHAGLPDHSVDYGDERSQRKRCGAGLQVGSGERKPPGGLATRQGLGRQPASRLVQPASAGGLPDRTGHRQRDQPRSGRPDHREGSARQRSRSREADHGIQRLLSGQ
jgi:multiple sugar transport system substrate-binding protein